MSGEGWGVADLATLQLLAWVPRAQKAYFAASKCKYIIWEWQDTNHETECLGIILHCDLRIHTYAYC